MIDDAQRVSEWAAMITSPLLVIDDMADEYIRSPWSIERMYMLINERYNSATPTIITSNIHPRELPDQRMVSRIMGESRILYMPLSDYRWRIKK